MPYFRKGRSYIVTEVEEEGKSLSLGTVLILVVLVLIAIFWASNILKPHTINVTTPTVKKPLIGLVVYKDLSLLESNQAISIAETLPQIKDLETRYTAGKDIKTAVVAVRIEQGKIVSYALGEASGANNYFPAVLTFPP
ncbi:MAG: hypothetical protein A2Z28_03975 [Chloroflexi bacterium RBG_16_51_9]|nr:MAG: hypothetical protein A2Z28_03975 [Chloroflexi bacterium RBG_16_51_9]